MNAGRSPFAVLLATALSAAMATPAAAQIQLTPPAPGEIAKPKSAPAHRPAAAKPSTKPAAKPAAPPAAGCGGAAGRAEPDSPSAPTSAATTSPP